MRGFTEHFYNGHPVFIRSEYENAHNNDGELERIADLTGVYYDSFSMAVNAMYFTDESLVYRNYSRELDLQLRNGANGADLWVPMFGGWVHEITGELVFGCRPSRDSYPCWCLRETDPMSELDSADIQNAARGALISIGLGLLAVLFCGGDEDDTEEVFSEVDSVNN